MLAWSCVCIRYPELAHLFLSNETCAKPLKVVWLRRSISGAQWIAALLLVLSSAFMALGEQAQWHKELDELDVSWEMESWRLRYNKKIQKILHVYMIVYVRYYEFDSVICEAGMLFKPRKLRPWQPGFGSTGSWTQLQPRRPEQLLWWTANLLVKPWVT